MRRAGLKGCEHEVGFGKGRRRVHADSRRKSQRRVADETDRNAARKVAAEDDVRLGTTEGA